MATENISNFVMDLNDHCFFCLKQVISEFPPSNDLHYLTQYLQLDMGKVFNSASIIPSVIIPCKLFDKDQKSKLKVRLCSSCASINKRFSGLYIELEKIRIQMESCMQLINRKLSETEGKETDLLTRNWNLSTCLNMSQEEIRMKREVLEELRREMKLKCSQRLAVLLPRVKLKKLTPKQLEVHMASTFERIADDNLVDEEVEIKLEEPYPSLNLSSTDNDPLEDYFEDYNPPNDPIADSQDQEMVSVPELDMESHEPIKGQLNVKPVERRRKYKIDCPYVIVRPPQASTEIDSTFDLSTGHLHAPLSKRSHAKNGRQI